MNAPPSASAPAPRSPRRLPFASALVLVATFALGGAAGIGVAPLLRPPPPPLPPTLQSLQLRSEQRQRIDAIIARHGPEVEAALGDALPRLRAVQARVALEIEAELDPAQREAFRRDRADRGPPMPR
jgi:hypothetical protein